jgi:hypothetical protein
MPFPALLARLMEKTKGRVFRADRSRADLDEERAKRAGGPGELSDHDWDDFLGRVEEGPQSEHGKIALFIEYFVPFA